MRRRALGLPVVDDKTEGKEAELQSTQKDEDDDEEEEKVDTDGHRVSWSYSQYVDALEKEEIIGRTNEDTFSCLSSEGDVCSYLQYVLVDQFY